MNQVGSLSGTPHDSRDCDGQEVWLEAIPTEAPGLAIAKSLVPGPPYQVYHRESGTVLAAAETIEHGQAIVSRIKNLADWDDAVPVQLVRSKEERASIKEAVFLAAEETKPV